MCHFMCCRRQSTARLELSAGAMLRDVAGKFMSAFTGRSEHPVTAKLLLVKKFYSAQPAAQKCAILCAVVSKAQHGLN